MIKGFIEVTIVVCNIETSYQVNINNIDCFKDKEIILNCGITLPVKETYEELKQKIKDAVK